ncbi:hypothetical protein GLOTRDRAFT_139037 [Gloeophyllum trabeum ATCC 11539]|uniref:Superoxide dismutase [Cu-Zn] n=1 Tax=Gloeophyllum trabeum (strain ATCC 11539 / FP-39264 / Madison 617) TaxID=670483 RepID=S7RJD9_GLOTA|nr:uncharacterized protein GLOTRDRAFT_139037 [Gloeophyllum trabeum ATCC 11539]EPQ54450.1 hypothetical protein GLOTRDRAFT_139037 [Gloeophyllum trabeum ATCC 11539]
MDALHSKPPSKRPLVITAVAAFVTFLLFWNVFLKPEELPLVTKAVVTVSGDSQVTGMITFTQSTKSGAVTIKGELKGLDPLAKRGFHIHHSGDVSSCAAAGSHFNPFSTTHGAPTDPSSKRHVGDLGNIESDRNGVAVFEFQDKLISLNGPLSIVGRAVVVHAGTDDLGRGGNDDSLKTGNAGGRSACGVIGIA